MQFEFNLTLIDWLLFEFNCKNILELFCVQCMRALYIHQILAIDQGNFLLLFSKYSTSHHTDSYLCIFYQQRRLLDFISHIAGRDPLDFKGRQLRRHFWIPQWSLYMILIELYQIKRLVLDIVGNSDVLYNINKIPWK